MKTEQICTAVVKTNNTSHSVLDFRPQEPAYQLAWCWSEKLTAKLLLSQYGLGFGWWMRGVDRFTTVRKLQELPTSSTFVAVVLHQSQHRQACRCWWAASRSNVAAWLWAPVLTEELIKSPVSSLPSFSPKSKNPSHSPAPVCPTGTDAIQIHWSFCYIVIMKCSPPCWETDTRAYFCGSCWCVITWLYLSSLGTTLQTWKMPRNSWKKQWYYRCGCQPFSKA